MKTKVICKKGKENVVLLKKWIAKLKASGRIADDKVVAFIEYGDLIDNMSEEVLEEWFYDFLESAYTFRLENAGEDGEEGFIDEDYDEAKRSLLEYGEWAEYLENRFEGRVETYGEDNHGDHTSFVVFDDNGDSVLEFVKAHKECVIAYEPKKGQYVVDDMKMKNRNEYKQYPWFE